MDEFYLIDDFVFENHEHHWIHLKDSGINDYMFAFWAVIYINDYDNWKCVLVRTDKESYYNSEVIVAMDEATYIDPLTATDEGVDKAYDYLLKNEDSINISCAVKINFHIKRELKRYYDSMFHK